MSNHQDHINLIWQIADLLRGPYRPPQYERVMLPMTVLRRFDCVLEGKKDAVLEKYSKLKGKFDGEALDTMLNKAAGQNSTIIQNSHLKKCEAHLTISPKIW